MKKILIVLLFISCHARGQIAPKSGIDSTFNPVIVLVSNKLKAGHSAVWTINGYERFGKFYNRKKKPFPDYIIVWGVFKK